MIVNKEIQSVFMRNLFPVEVDKESELCLKRNTRIFKGYL